MNVLIKIFILLLIIILGFLTISMNWHIGIILAVFNDDSMQQNPDLIASYFENNIRVWAIGTIIGCGYPFIQNKLRFILLGAPVILPLLYGLSRVLVSLP